MDTFLGPSWLTGKPERLIGATRLIKTSDWMEVALFSSTDFERDLQDLRFPESDVQEALALRAQLAERDRQLTAELKQLKIRDGSLNYAETPADVSNLLRERASLSSRLRDWLGGRELRVRDVNESSIRIPLFLMSAPEPDDCMTMFQQSVMKGKALEWNLTVGGSGLGGSSTYRVSSSSGFSAKSGERKVVFAPVTVTVARVDVVAKGRVLSSGVQVVPSQSKETRAPGLTLLEPDAHPPLGGLLMEFSLLGDTTGAVATYNYTYEHQFEGDLKVGFEAFGIETSATFQQFTTRDYALELKLRGGYDYLMHSLAEGDGMAWVSPGVT